jgi:foldase protein PrsA
MRISRKLAALAAFFVIAIAVSACGGSSIPGNSVASVAQNPITLQAVNHWMFIAAKSQAAQAAQQGETAPVIVANDPPKFAGCIKQVRTQIPALAKAKDAALRTDCKQVFQQFSSQVMTFLIESYWYQADAHKLGITYSDAQLTKDLDKAKKTEFPTTADYQNYLSQSGETEQDVRYSFRVNKLYMKLVQRYEKKITAAAIAAYFAKHQTQFGTQASRSIHLVRTKTQAEAQAAFNALKSGHTWDAVAKQYAEDASAKTNGGLLSGITNNEEEHAVNQAIFSNPVNKVVGPIKGIFGWYVAEVVKITPATHETLAKATPTIKELLTNTEQTAAEAKVTALSKKNWHSLTICRTLYSVSNCVGYKAPKTTTTATPTPTPTPTTSSTGTATAPATTGTASTTTASATTTTK